MQHSRMALVQGLDQQRMHLLFILSGLVGITDAGDHIFAKGDLRIHDSSLVPNFPGLQVQQVKCDLCGSNIDRNSIDG